MVRDGKSTLPLRLVCISLLAYLVSCRPLPGREPKLRPFRRGAEVEDFCQTAIGQRLRCHRADGILHPEHCPLKLTGCYKTGSQNASGENATAISTNSNGDATAILTDSSRDATAISTDSNGDATPISTDSNGDARVILTRPSRDVTAISTDSNGDDSCQCASDGSNSACACTPSPTAVTSAADDLKTTILTLQVYLYYMWGYLRRRAPCVHKDEEKAAENAIRRLELRLLEINPPLAAYALDKGQVLCGAEIGPFKNSNSKVYNPVNNGIVRIYHTRLDKIHRDQLPLGSVCDFLVNNSITNKGKRLNEISNALQHLKTLLEAYSCVTRGIANSDDLCCYISCCGVVPRIEQCLYILDPTALHAIAEDVLQKVPINRFEKKPLPNVNFLQFFGSRIGASFNCTRH